MKPPFRIPRATYRLQMHAKFTFEQLAEIVAYLDELGVSDVYTSPIFRASPGSTHGYDVCDHNEISPELGGIDGLMKVHALLKERGMGLLLDFVPNHMGIEGPFNWRWIDVLEHGRESRFASFFDILWNPRQVSWQDRILVPMLHDFYGRVLEEGGIQLRYDEAAFWVAYGSLRFPLRPESYGAILERLAWFKSPGAPLAQKLELLSRQFRSLPKATATESLEASQQRNRQRDALRQELARLIESEHLAADLEQVLAALNGQVGQPASFDHLHEILEEQNYRLAYWKSGTHEINYRRFFAVDTLVGLHMEEQAVFDDTHRLLHYLLEKGVVTGVRIDHIDGLWDPAHYLQRLSNLGQREGEPVYVLVEKIVTEGEQLPDSWAVHGTTGYEFAGSLIDLLIDAQAEPAFTRIYRDFAGMALAPRDLEYQLKLFIMEELFPNAIEGLALDLESGVKSDRRWRDWTMNDLRLALSRIIACLSVYRTYRRTGQPMSLADIGVVERAVTATMRRNFASDPAPFHFLQSVWTGTYPDAHAAPEMKAWADGWVSKLQQYTGAIMAKSVEDTLFYRYVRMFGTNEVGHHPAEFGRPISAFHEANLYRLQHWPSCLLSTSTHDTKVAEDVRARLLALSELPERWDAALRAWSQANRALKTKLGELFAPDANEEYLLYQILLGAWPLEEGAVNDEFRERIKSYMRKALSEAKANTNWASPNEPWMKACDDFVEAILDRGRAAPFWESFMPFAEEIAWRGMNLSLVQIALKATVPGVPDFYQGTELWDLSLVDPDNRRPVDYAARRRLLSTLEQVPVEDLYASWKDGRIKMKLMRMLLRHRRDFPALFSRGSYAPVEVTGEKGDRVVAFLRQEGGEQLLVVAVRHLGAGETRDWKEICRGAELEMPTTPAVWADLLEPRHVAGRSKRLPVSHLLGALPVGVFRAVPEENPLPSPSS
jgi:(1->4)-alpha-D-glucan 1-alpha-D-glucosylmutase